VTAGGPREHEVRHDEVEHDEDREHDREPDHEHGDCHCHCHDPYPAQHIYIECHCCHDRRENDDDDCHGRHHHHHRPGRPTRPRGQDNGRIDDPTPLTPGDVNNPLPTGVFPGPRSKLYLPYLFMRANSGDLGARPVVGPFWESPDIFIMAGVDPGQAPPVPGQLGQVALANQRNTIYAHVWNFGQAAAAEVLVEFYWCNPSLGITESSVQLIAQTTTSLGARGSGQSHAVVKCPEAWTPTYVNGGHECLLVRVWDDPADLPGEPKFDASINRHVAQRNIHVNAPGQQMAMPLAGGGAPAGPGIANPVLINVGQLYGAPAQIAVERVTPNAMPWLQLHTMARGVFPGAATPTGAALLSPPGDLGGGVPVGAGAAQQQATGDNQQIAFASSDQRPAAGEAHVYRVTGTQAGQVFGGYTVVLLG
jgi:hypothetical protein